MAVHWYMCFFVWVSFKISSAEEHTVSEWATEQPRCCFVDVAAVVVVVVVVVVVFFIVVVAIVVLEW